MARNGVVPPVTVGGGNERSGDTATVKSVHNFSQLNSSIRANRLAVDLFLSTDIMIKKIYHSFCRLINYLPPSIFPNSLLVGLLLLFD